MQNVTHWLEELGLDQYADVFTENAIDETLLADLTDADLEKIGVKLGHRKKILKAIVALQGIDPGLESPDTVSDCPRTSPARSTQAERRQLTIMFCDLVGSTELSHKLDPEDLRDVNRAYQDACKAAIERYAGYVARYMGDGVLAYFGFPQAHEDDAERAVRSGLDVVKAMDEVNSGVGREKEIRVAVRVGIATGPTVVGDLIGEGASQESAVVGETPNLAARLQGIAKPNTVVVAPDTHRLTAGHIQYRDLGEIVLKGIVQPVAAWQALGEGSAETRFEALHGQRLTPLVGRNEEVDLLTRRWERARQSEGQVVLISGEAGFGKSRLCETVRARIDKHSHIRIRYQCSPYHTNSALYPVISQLERAANIEPQCGTGEKLDRLEALLRESDGAIEVEMPLLAALLSIEMDDRCSPLELDAVQQKEQTLLALVNQLDGLSAKQPVLVVFEDVHWVDPTTVELLDRLVEKLRNLRVLLLVTSRPGFNAPWTDKAQVTHLILSRMDRRACREMLYELAGSDHFSEEVVNDIVMKSDGVPLFVEELTKALIESGETIAPLDVPATLQDSLMARLDRLGSAKQVAQAASVIGREFPYWLLLEVAMHQAPVLADALATLESSELVQRRGDAPEALYRFKHALVRDAAYESLLRSTRKQLHCRIADYLKENPSGQARPVPELLAHHYTEGDRPEEAIGHWKLAAERAVERVAHLEAIGHLERGLAVCRGLPDSPEYARLEAGLLTAMAASMRIIDRYDDALAALDHAEALSTTHGHAVNLAEIHYLRGNVYFPLGRHHDCLRQHELSRRYARQAGSPEAEARALSGLGDAFYMKGQMITAHQHFATCVDICREHELRRVEVANLQMRGLTRFFQNEHAAALDDTLTAAQAARELGEGRSEIPARLISGEILANMAELERAKAQIEQCQVLVRRLSAWRFEPLALSCMAKVLRAEGRHAQAREILDRALDISRENGFSFSGPVVLGALALTADDVDVRQSALSEGADLLTAGCVSHCHFRFYRDAIEAALQARDWHGAERFANALHEFTRSEPLPWTNFYVSRARALAAHGRAVRCRETQTELMRLLEYAKGVGLRLAVPALEAALTSE